MSTALTINHSTVVTGIQRVDVQISKNEWNDKLILAGGTNGMLLIYDDAHSGRIGGVALGSAGTVLTGTGAEPAFSASPILTSVKVAQSGLQVLDTNDTHYLKIAAGSNLTADHTLTFTTADSDRTITLSGNPTLADWFDQSVKTTASPTFDSPSVTSLSASGYVALSTTPATTGALRLANDVYAYARNAANSANIRLLGLDTSNVVIIGSSNGRWLWVDSAGTEIARLTGTAAAGSGGYDLGFGIETFSALTTGEDNTAFGYRSQASVTTGGFNTGYGYRSLQDNVIGNSNTGLGQAALQYNTADGNTGVGALSLQFNTTGVQNVAMGFRSLTNMDGGSYNVAVGYSAMYNATTASRSVAIGRNALLNVGSGFYNIGIGYGALASVAGAAAQNVAIGGEALGSTTGNSNIGIGYFAGFYSNSSSELYIDGFDRTNNANEKARAIVYGVLNSTAASQRLFFNTGATQVSLPIAFASLPGSPLEGQEANITDCNTAVWGATAAAGGSTHAKVRYNGTNWTVVGI